MKAKQFQTNSEKDFLKVYWITNWISTEHRVSAFSQTRIVVRWNNINQRYFDRNPLKVPVPGNSLRKSAHGFPAIKQINSYP